MKIYRVTECSAELTEAFARLLPQLSAAAKLPSEEHIGNILSNPNNHLFVAEAESRIVGMLSLVVVDIPTGRKAWIEDVVVDSEARGLHIGQLLVERAIAESQSLGAKSVNLTSNPSRRAAHALYLKCGFEVYDTALFRLNLPAK